MDLTKYEPIDGREGLRRLADGKKVYDHSGRFWFIDENEEVKFYDIRTGEARKSGCELYYFVSDSELFIKKPFDVRQAMFERPNEWVGAYNDGVGWWAVGFDLNHCCVVSKQMPISYPVDAEYAGADFPKPEQLNICIPIEDVPEEETR